MGSDKMDPWKTGTYMVNGNPEYSECYNKEEVGVTKSACAPRHL